jgi:flavin reductase (DIM6/NTAB) family NADH-FMN oxidoreductase RutF
MDAPMIGEVPITHACKLVKNLNFGETHYLFIGELKKLLSVKIF